MYCYFSASCSNPLTRVTSLHLAALLKKLCELSPSETCVCVCVLFVIDRCWLNFILHVLLFFSQSQPAPNPVDISLPGSASNSPEKAPWVIPVSDSCVFFFGIDRCWLNFILHVLLFFSQLQPPPNPSDSLIPASDYSEEPKWVMFACILFYVAIIMFNNFGHVPFFSMTGKILSQGIFWRNYITSKTMLSLQIYWTIIDRFAKAF